MDNLVWNAQVNLLRSAKKIRYLHRKHVLRYQTDTPIVFGIGDSRTGTRSLSHALEILDIPTTHWLRAGQKPDIGWISWLENTEGSYPLQDNLR